MKLSAADRRAYEEYQAAQHYKASMVESTWPQLREAIWILASLLFVLLHSFQVLSPSLHLATGYPTDNIAGVPGQCRKTRLYWEIFFHWQRRV
jgi:hypothetical protein